MDTAYGAFSAKFVNVHYDTKNQQAGGDAQRLSTAGQPGGLLDGLASVRGVDNLLGLDWSVEDKYTLNLAWKNGPYQVLISGTQWGEFFDSAHTKTIDGEMVMWTVDSMTMMNLTLGTLLKMI